MFIIAILILTLTILRDKNTLFLNTVVAALFASFTCYCIVTCVSSVLRIKKYINFYSSSIIFSFFKSFFIVPSFLYKAINIYTFSDKTTIFLEINK